MDADLLTQRFYFEQRTTRLLDDAVELSQKGLFGGSTMRFPYEQIPEHSLTIATRAKLPLFVTAMLALLAFAFLEVNDSYIWPVVAAALVILGLQFWLGKRDYVGFDCNGRLLLLHARKPSVQAVEQFMDRIRAKRAEYLKRTYAFVQPHRRPVDELQKLFALAQEGALTYREYEAFKREIMASYSMAAAPEPDETAVTN